MIFKRSKDFQIKDLLLTESLTLFFPSKKREKFKLKLVTISVKNSYFCRQILEQYQL